MTLTKMRASWCRSVGCWPWRVWGLTLALGGLGGVVFQGLGLPLPWMLGAITATTVTALAGVRMQVPGPLRAGMITVLGVMLGSAFHPGLIGDMMAWGPSLLGLILYVPLATLVVRQYYRRLSHYGPVTATCAAAPGGLTQLTLIGGALGGDDRTIALSHGIRILVVVSLLPTAFTMLAGYHRPTGGGGAAVGDLLSLTDVAWLLGCAGLGVVVGRVLRLPAGVMIGPMLLSGLAHGFGLTVSHPPTVLVAMAQSVIGTGIGVRFVGIPVRALAQTFLAAIGATVLLLALTLVFAAALAAMTGLSFPALVLAYAPGGVVEMSLVSLALGVDVAFVSSHHVARILLVVVLVPLVVRLAGFGQDPIDKRKDC